MAKSVRVSLANKCLLLFGAAVVLILSSALAVVWVRMQVLVTEGQEETARKLANAWLSDMIQLGGALTPVEELHGNSMSKQNNLSMTLIEKDEFEIAERREPFLADAIEQFTSRNDRPDDYSRLESRTGGAGLYWYARAIRKSDLSRIRGGAAGGFLPTLDTPSLADPLEMVLVIRLRSDRVAQQLTLNRIYIIAAGLLAGFLAIGVFWFITTRLILSPVRVLRDTAEKVSEGDINIRADVNTGDEFEQLSHMFNHMLETLQSNQDQLRGINKSLDLKLGELAETNVALYEANKIKGEFLANVSHELRTPLNSVIGFAEILEETLKDRTGPVDEKRKRYIANIVTSSRRLLDLINDLLDLAKIDAGRMDLVVNPMNVADTAEGLINLIRPQAEKSKIELRLRVDPNIPLVQTDAGKFQQIIFNFLSNAVKFTPPGGTVTLTGSVTPANAQTNTPARLRVGVADTGPGIAKADHERIFDKFTQLDSTVTKEHAGTGLGLTISRELASLLQGRIELESDTGRGATFTLVIPLVLEARTTPLMPNPAQAQTMRS
ncbi:MAG: HAMP domain-containing histidine kinase [Planctomycetes bacterium]|nr:HAMP domain-containing histidine kinase [Planctomycetota bacterium]